MQLHQVDECWLGQPQAQRFSTMREPELLIELCSLLFCNSNQELMSGEAAKERATTAYARVPSKSKLLANELPNMETCSSI